MCLPLRAVHPKTRHQLRVAALLLRVEQVAAHGKVGPPGRSAFATSPRGDAALVVVQGAECRVRLGPRTLGIRRTSFALAGPAVVRSLLSELRGRDRPPAIGRTGSPPGRGRCRNLGRIAAVTGAGVEAAVGYRHGLASLARDVLRSLAPSARQPEPEPMTRRAIRVNGRHSSAIAATTPCAGSVRHPCVSTAQMTRATARRHGSKTTCPWAAPIDSCTTTSCDTPAIISTTHRALHPGRGEQHNHRTISS